MVEVGGSNPPGPTKIKNPPLGGFFGFGGVGLDEGRCLTIATHRAFVRRSKAKAPGGFSRQRQWRLKTIRLVLPDMVEPTINGFFVFEGLRHFQDGEASRKLF